MKIHAISKKKKPFLILDMLENLISIQQKYPSILQLLSKLFIYNGTKNYVVSDHLIVLREKIKSFTKKNNFFFDRVVSCHAEYFDIHTCVLIDYLTKERKKIKNDLDQRVLVGATMKRK